MCEIEILTTLEFNRLMSYSFEQFGNIKNPILGFYDSDLDLIKLGKIKTASIAVKTLIHEHIHKTLNQILDKQISHKFDLLVYSNKAKSKKLGLI